MPEKTGLYSIGSAGAAIRQISSGSGDETRWVAVLQDVGERVEVHVTTLKRKRTLMGAGTFKVSGDHELTAQIAGRPLMCRVNAQANALLVANDLGQILYFAAGECGFELKQTFAPFGVLAAGERVEMEFLLGGTTAVITGTDGRMAAYSLFRTESAKERLFGRIKDFPAMSQGLSDLAVSARNKAFLAASQESVSLRYLTTGAVRWKSRMPFKVQKALIGGKYDRLFFLDEAGTLHAYRLDDPHPEAGFKAFFGKIWYEGYTEPVYAWQSTGGTDEFESKLSMVPLLFGSLKGTFYALVFALPLALLAALYTSQFAAPNFKQFVKPAMEIMASLPSVVLGFLGALWLAPLIERQMPSVFLVILALPAAALAFGGIWSRIPAAKKAWCPDGREMLVMAPVVLVTAWAAWQMGPWVERIFFTVADPETGKRIADFRLWWPAVTGLDFEQRNSLVVGFMMGFAVIPIIFTISEDALSNVSASLKSASLALGASRWQTAIRIIVPTASAGILSAVMIGFGRAVGETMIVVMATGNTPVMNWNIFSGMRTLSANIAVELPEAPYLGTLYRTLFLGAFLLFVLTFAVNTLAEFLRERLRTRYENV
ncbi:MAG: ABC transporter permease subunit [Candidatus Omnitrophica bacterium]|nr:ABC transporter permease subunit [Candidatus Omnitrophota bacterium]